MDYLAVLLGIVITLVVLGAYSVYTGNDSIADTKVIEKELKKIPYVCKFEGTCNFAMRENCPKCCPRYNNSIAEEESE